ncbi:MAG TPA: hypothetical protein VEC06_19965 [Paucimonas sp.]|nr:hypothetical protein [Paucimonas sp.]
MAGPTAAALLRAWERGLDLSPTRRSLALLAAVSAEDPEQLAALSIGARDARLLRLRQAVFGDAVAAVAQCPACGERLDAAFRIGDLCTGAEDESSEPVHHLRSGDTEIAYRVPTSADLLAIPDACDDDQAQRFLLRRCVVSARIDGVATAADALPADAAAALSHAMHEADPQACTELSLTCPACGHAWNSLFDIAAFLWTEVHAWVLRTLRDVHTLARAYGWREADILAMSAHRRRLYLELASS